MGKYYYRFEFCLFGEAVYIVTLPALQKNVAEPKQTIKLPGKWALSLILINMYKDLIEKNDPNTKGSLKT